MGLPLLGPALIVLVAVSAWRSSTQTPPSPVSPTAADYRLPLPFGETFHRNPAGLAGVCALIAFLTCAVVQIFKNQGGIRASVNARSIDTWLHNRFQMVHFTLNDDATATKESNQKTTTPNKRETDEAIVAIAEEQLRELCSASRDDFYELPTAQFCGQIATAIDLILLKPRSYLHVFSALTAGGGRDHRNAVDEFILRADLMESELASKIADSPEKEREVDEYDRLRARISNYAQRALDGLQLAAARRWRRKLTFTSLQASLGISLAVVLLVAPPVHRSGLFLFFYSTIVCATAGALLAPLAYDLMAGLRALAHR